MTASRDWSCPRLFHTNIAPSALPRNCGANWSPTRCVLASTGSESGLRLRSKLRAPMSHRCVFCSRFNCSQATTRLSPATATLGLALTPSALATTSPPSGWPVAEKRRTTTSIDLTSCCWSDTHTAANPPPGRAATRDLCWLPGVKSFNRNGSVTAAPSAPMTRAETPLTLPSSR